MYKIAAALGLFSCQAFCVDTMPVKGGDIKIDAQEQIDYYEQGNVYIARGNVHVTRGEERLSGDEIKIYIKRDKTHRMIQAIEVLGNASLESPQGSLCAERLYYDVPQEILHAFGNTIKLTTETYKLMADESMRYCKLAKTGKAKGHVHFIEEDKSIKADMVDLVFQENTDGPPKKNVLTGKDSRMQIVSIKAKGNVVLAQQDRRCWADTGVYKAETGCAVLEGNVRLRNGKDFATGAKAFINFDTRKAGLISGDHGRVRLLLNPKRSLKKP